MATGFLRILFLVHILSLFSVSVHSFRPGSRSKTLNFPHQEVNDGIKRIRRNIPTQNEASASRSRTARQAESPADESAGSGTTHGIQVTKFDLNDPHPELIVHWAGKGSDVILCLTRDITQTTHSASYVYFSSDYGATFTNKSTTMFNTFSGQRPVYDRFYSSKADEERYMFTDVVNSLVTTTEDFGYSFSTFTIPFKPTSIYTHAVNPDIVLGMDENDESKRLYISMNFGGTWDLVEQDVKSFSWGVEPWDRTDTIYVERLEADGTSSVSKSDDFYETRELVIMGVKDFEVRDDYLFATQEKFGTDDELELLVSHDRGPFRNAQFPFTVPNREFYIADASEEQVFVCVHHQDLQTNLYISEARGVEFALSLMNISYYNPEGVGKDTWLSRYADEPFADFHKVDGLRGIYAANVLLNTDASSSYSAENMATYGTFDKGGEWFLVPAPDQDADENPYDCGQYNVEKCSLHLSQRFSQLAPGSRTVPILSKSSAPGLILATGKVGKTLLGNETMGFNVYLSATAGASWYEVLRGNHFFAFGDHGGVVTAVEQRGDTNAVKYSVNEGETWHSEAFSESKIYVYGLMTEPGEKSLTFTVFGSETETHSWLIVQINFRNVFSTNCADDDYKQWWPGEEFPQHSCLLGRKTIYERRRVHSDCFNGRDYDRPISSVNCSCDRDDFECDFGFMESDGNQWDNCVHDPDDDRDPTLQPNPCPEDTFWRRSRGYRKVEGDTCKGGDEKYYEADQVSCPVAESSEFILYAERTDIHRYFLNDGTNERLPIDNLKLATAVDYDVDHDCYYYAEVTFHEIHRFCPGLTEEQDRMILSDNLDMVEGLAFDWLADNLYWVDSEADHIEVARYDGHHRRILTMNITLDQPRAIALDPKRGYMYWTDWGENAYIAMAEMDGHNAKKLVTTGVYWPNGLAIDDQSSHIFWTDAHFDRIESAWLDGSHREVLRDEDTPHPFSIGVYKNKIYWDDWSQLSIQSANKYTGGDVRTVVRNMSSAMDLKIFHNASQQGVNPCSSHNGGCTHLCIVKPNASNPDVVTRVCLCPDNMKVVITPDGREECQCEPGEKLNITTGYCFPNAGHTCEPDQFQCSSSDRCIPSFWKCDRENDCSDSSDELNCPFFTCNADQEFTCKSNSKCIPNSWICDHYDDCGDSSDEEDCEFPTCSPDQFQCDNLRCVSASYRCDLDNDCWDNSDERDCEITDIPTTQPAGCDANSTQCEPNGRCIPIPWLCDGDNDCGNNWDEQNCNASTCESYQFTCENGECIPSYWKCDDYDDCGDNSDEINCPTTTMSPWTTSNPFDCDSGKFQCFGSSQCIPYNWKCDNYPDCPDGSDEYDCVHNITTTIYPSSCQWNDYVCDNGQCIPGDWECDFYQDCSDNSDEDHCYTTSMPFTTPGDPGCGFFRVPCGPGATPHCVWQWLLCDGDNDCSNGADEAHCGTEWPSTTIPVPTTVASCSSGYFKCANGQKCIQRSEKCDGHFDCSDNSDEVDCPTSAPTEPPNICGDGQFFCSYFRNCIDQLMHCDGESNCGFGEDEVNCNGTYTVQEMVVGVGPDIKSATVHYSLPNVPTQFDVWLYKREADPLSNQPGHDLPSAIHQPQHFSAHSGGRQSYTWSNLKAETDYVFTASIHIGEKEYNKVPLISYRTPADGRVIPAPSNVHGTLRDFQSQLVVDLTWSYNIDGATFKVFYRMNYSSSFNLAGSTQSKFFTIFSLEEDKLYYVSVSAKIDSVTGNLSSEFPIFIGKGSIHHPPTNLLVSNMTKDSVDLKWTRPDEPSVIGYMVYASLSSDEFKKNIVNSTKTSITVRNLCPRLGYVFRVAAYNDQGRGPLSASREGMTTGTPYTAPQSLTAMVLSKSVIKLQWLEPSSKPSGKVSYDIAYDSGTPTDFKIHTSSLSYNITGLEGGVTYQFAVRLAVTCENAPSALARNTTMYDHTLPPRSLQALDNDFQAITLQWKSPRDLMPEAVEYILFYWNTSQPSNRHNVSVPATQDRHITKKVSNLVPGANYSFEVQANVPSAHSSERVTSITKRPSEPTEFQALSENGIIHLYWGPAEDTWNKSLGFAVYILRMEDVFPGQKDATIIPPDALTRVENNLSLWTIVGGIQAYHFEFSTELKPDLYAITVSVDQFKGYYGKVPRLKTATQGRGAGPPKAISKNQALYAGIAVGLVVIVLVVIVVYFAVRHRRLQQSFMSFANSHYDTRSGTATFATSEDDDGGDLGSDDDQPLIHGFSDDVPLVIA